MIRTFNSISLKGKVLYEGRLQLYSIVQRNFLQEHTIIKNQPTEDASNSSRDAIQQDIQQRNERESAGPEVVGGIGPGAYINTRIGKATENSFFTSALQSLDRAGGPACFVSARDADKIWSAKSSGISEGVGRAGV